MTPDPDHGLRVTYAGFHCTCGGWKIGSWNGAKEAHAAHVEKETAR